MHQPNRSLRVGVTAILLSVLLRLWAAGAPEKILSRLLEPEAISFLIYLETGRDVRFSPSLEVFSPDFMESPPAVAKTPPEPVIPAFSDTEKLTLYYAADKDPDIASLLQAPLSWDLRGVQPTVLILHTHSTESYTKKKEAYTETSRWRTLDEEYNMLSIGAQVAELLAQKGITAVQHRELNDYPSYNGSYTRARKIIASYLEEYPTIQLILDLHRDASEGEHGQMRTLAHVDGQACAQLMLVVGTNHKDYEENLSIALKLHAQLEQSHSGIMRPLQLRAQRFNQDLCPGSLLIEVGAAGNTHPEARLAAEALAEAVNALAEGANLSNTGQKASP